jgi:hypothetical protein
MRTWARLHANGVPADLVIARAVCGPALLAAAVVHAPGAVLAGIVTVAFLLDVYDRVLAIRSGVASRSLRRVNTIVTIALYTCATLALVIRTNVEGVYAICIAAIVVLEAVRWVLDRLRYGRMAAYDMWSARAWAVLLWLGFSEGFLSGRSGSLFDAALIVGMLAEVEGLGASLVLSARRSDVHTLWHAIQIERGIQRSA